MKQFILGLVFGVLAAVVVTHLTSRSDAPIATDSDGFEAAATPTKDAEPPPIETSQTATESKSCEMTLALIRAAHDDAVKESNQNEELVAFLEELVEKSGAGTPQGNPVQFPTGLNDVYTPEGFEAALDKLKEECSDFFPPDATADCSEFPCAVAMVSTNHPASGQLSDKCPLYSQLFGKSGGAMANGFGNGEFASHYIPTPDGEGVEDYLDEYQGNLSKRRNHRFQEFQTIEANRRFAEPCAGGDASACLALGNALEKTAPSRSEELQRRACELGDANGCNNVAWRRCHDEGNCDDEALRLARTATERAPTNGQIWDTLAYVFCQRGNVADANAAYAEACAKGHQPDCGKECQP